MSEQLAGKVAIITGAAGGQGAAEAKLFVERGAKVLITDFNDELGEKTAAELGENALFAHHDVSSEEDWAAVVEKAIEAFGTIDILVNNAGILKMAPIEEIDAAGFDRIMAVNVRGAFLGIKAVLPTLKTKGGSIVNISSLAGMQGQPYATAYSASKYAVRGLTKSAALELGRYGIRVNSVHPGTIATPMTMANLRDLDAPFPLAAMNRIGTPADIAPLVAFLASDESTYISGEEHVVDGGSLAGQSAQFMDAMMAQKG